MFATPEEAEHAFYEALEQADSIRLMPTLKLFKIGVQLDLTGKEEKTSRSQPVYSEKDRLNADRRVSERDREVIRVLQQDLPIVSRPFAQWGQSLGMSEDDLLQYAQDFIRKGQMRRFAAVLYHRKAGFRANGMGVWAVPENRVDEVGAIMASYRAVSHCYLRPTYSDWPYSIFTMVHGQTEQDCEAVLQEIERETQVVERDVLYSTVEYKKTRLQYFTPDMEEWERKVAASL